MKLQQCYFTIYAPQMQKTFQKFGVSSNRNFPVIMALVKKNMRGDNNEKISNFYFDVCNKY